MRAPAKTRRRYKRKAEDQKDYVSEAADVSLQGSYGKRPAARADKKISREKRHFRIGSRLKLPAEQSVLTYH